MIEIQNVAELEQWQLKTEIEDLKGRLRLETKLTGKVKKALKEKNAIMTRLAQQIQECLEERPGVLKEKNGSSSNEGGLKDK